jgi:hypothetical protein
MNYVTCSCGCNLFETLIPLQFDESDFRVWNYASKLKAEVATVPVAKCIKCGRITIPATSMAGKNTTDPEVKAYAQLIKDVEIYNNSISASDANLELIQKHINKNHELESKIAALEGELGKQFLESKSLSNKVLDIEDSIKKPKEITQLTEAIREHKEVEEVVKTTKRGRKNTKTTV